MYAGDWAWLYAWIAVTLFSLAMQYVAPTWIMPLFNKFTPLEEGELRSEIERYTEKVDFNLSGLFVIDGSKRSSKSNAFFTGFGKNKRVALYDTLIENHTTQELVAVLARNRALQEETHRKRDGNQRGAYRSALLSVIHISGRTWLVRCLLYGGNVGVCRSGILWNALCSNRNAVIDFHAAVFKKTRIRSRCLCGRDNRKQRRHDFYLEKAIER